MITLKLQLGKVLIFYLFGGFVFAYRDQSQGERQEKRRAKRWPNIEIGLIQLDHMIDQITGFRGHDNVGYGCHCGPGGYGKPLDARDLCCAKHDLCYDVPVCPDIVARDVEYDYEYINDTTDGTDVMCINKIGTCEYDACICDRIFAFCLKNEPFNQNYLMGYYVGNDLVNAAADRKKYCGKAGTPFLQSSLDEFSNDPEKQCLTYGDVRNITIDYKRHVSIPQVDRVAPFLEMYRGCITDMSERHGLQPSLIAATLTKLIDMPSGNRLPSVNSLIECYNVNITTNPGDSCVDAICSFSKEAILTELLHNLEGEETQLNDEAPLLTAIEALAGDVSDSRRFTEDIVVRAQRLQQINAWKCAAEIPSISNETKYGPSDQTAVVGSDYYDLTQRFYSVYSYFFGSDSGDTDYVDPSPDETADDKMATEILPDNTDSQVSEDDYAAPRQIWKDRPKQKWVDTPANPARDLPEVLLNIQRNADLPKLAKDPHINIVGPENEVSVNTGTNHTFDSTYIGQSMGGNETAVFLAFSTASNTHNTRALLVGVMYLWYRICC